MLKKIRRFFLYLFLSSLVYVLITKFIEPPITITQITNAFGLGLKRDYVSSNNISYNAKLAVIASEDQLFPDHSGFDWKSIKKAMAYNKRKPNRVRGASTISQQVAKNVFLWQGRSWIRKGFEVYFRENENDDYQSYGIFENEIRAKDRRDYVYVILEINFSINSKSFSRGLCLQSTSKNTFLSC
mgnify:CR=1 FL=1